MKRMGPTVAFLLLLSACGAAVPQIVVTPMTAEHERLFDNSLDLVGDPSILEGAWLDEWEDEVSGRVQMADTVGLVEVTAIRRDTDLQRRDTLRVVCSVLRTRFGTFPESEIALPVRDDESSFSLVARSEGRLMRNQFVLFVKWTRGDGDTLIPRWHLSPAADPVVRRVNSLAEQRSGNTTRRRVIVREQPEE